MVGGIGSVPLPATIPEIVPPFAVKLTFAITVACALGLKRTVTDWVAPIPTRVNGLPETMPNGAEVTTVPETVPPAVFCTAKALSTKPPTFTLPKFTMPVGLTAKSGRAIVLGTGVEQALSRPLEFTALIET
jgi:hypothetical protein